MELTLNNKAETATGTIYCTDEISNTIVLKKSLVHTTLSSEITVINADVVTARRIITEADESDDNNNKSSEAVLPNVSRRMVEERERRAIKLMEESFSHINEQVRVDCTGRDVIYVLFNYHLFHSQLINPKQHTNRHPPKDKKYSTNFSKHATRYPGRVNPLLSLVKSVLIHPTLVMIVY